MTWVYVLYSESTDTFYKDQTENLHERLERHNKGYEKFTKAGRPWKLVLSIQCENRSEAVKLEKKIKNLSRKRLCEFIDNRCNNVAGPDQS
jgi:putative endonuclease